MLSCPLPRWSAALVTVCVVSTVAFGTPAARSAAEQDQPPAAARSAQAKPQPPVQWLKDAEGREYRLEPIEKNQAQKVAPDKVRMIWGTPADLVKEDEKFFYIKLYRMGTPPPVTRAAAPVRRAPAAEPLPRTSQRLRWTDYGAGLPTAGQWREGLALVDMTGDGKTDIVASPARKSLRPPSIFVHDGKAWKRTATQYPQRPYDYGDVAVGDLNSDGTPDLAFGLHLRGLIALRGAANGQFEDASTGLPFATTADMAVFSTRAIALTDCNADGRLDIVALGEGPRLATGGAAANPNVASGVATFVQQADGSWSTVPATAQRLFGASIALADVDGDGKQDVVTASGTLGDNRVWHRGDGTCKWEAQTVDAVRRRAYVTAVAAADVNKDNRAEVILGYTSFDGDAPTFGVDVLTLGQGGAWSRRPLLREARRSRIEAVGTGDLDGDDAIDIAVVGDEGAVTLFLGDGKGTFTRERQVLASPGTCGGGALAVGDLDRDGLADLVIGYAQESTPALPDVCKSEGGIVAWKTQRASAPGGKSPAKPAAKPAAASKPPASKPATPPSP